MRLARLIPAFGFPMSLALAGLALGCGSGASHDPSAEEAAGKAIATDLRKYHKDLRAAGKAQITPRVRPGKRAK
jgi:hypothetical protein